MTEQDTNIHKELTQEQMFVEKFEAKKKRFWINTIELVLGIIFLIISFQYLQSHPAEKNSVFSSMDTFVTKIHNLTGGLFGSNTELAAQKQELVSIYMALLDQIGARECKDDSLENKITVRMNQLENLSDEQFSKQHSAFRNYAGIYADEIVKECAKKE